MRDVLFVLVIIGFFALAAAYVRACARIIGPEEVTPNEPTNGDLAESVAVGVPGR